MCNLSMDDDDLSEMLKQAKQEGIEAGYLMAKTDAAKLIIEAESSKWTDKLITMAELHKQVISLQPGGKP